MKNKFMKKTLAAALALTLVSGGLPTAIGGNGLSKPAIVANAQGEGNAVVSEDNKTLKLSGNITYDDLNDFRSGSGFDIVVCEKGTVFPADCYALFSNISAHYFDLKNADTSNVTDMQYMFQGTCDAQTIDLTSFDTSKVTNMDHMFFDSSVKSILVSNKWNTNMVTSSTDMFTGCTHLVGGELVKYDATNTNDVTYATSDKYLSLVGETFTLADGNYMTEAFLDEYTYRRYVFVVPKSEIEGKSKAKFDISTHEGQADKNYSIEKNVYYTGMTLNGVHYTPSENSVMFIVTIRYSLSLFNKCEISFE